MEDVTMREIPFRNQSRFGWYVAKVLVRFEWEDENKFNPNRRCTVWENEIILQAPDREEAYAKAMEQGQLDDEPDYKMRVGGRRGRWVFEGLTSLLPIYDELEDGAEIAWMETEGKAVKTVQGWVREKTELEIFDDVVKERAWLGKKTE